jgi:1-acyl-sn-glycerol-3-phosphate acyltransferase
VSDGFPRWPYRRDVRFVGDALRDQIFARIVRHWVTLNVEGTENLAQVNVPSIFIFNHTDDFDGPVIYEALPPVIRRSMTVAIGADIMGDHRALAFGSRLGWGGFAFSRTAPFRPSLKNVAAMLDTGHHVLFAPEGRLSTNGELLEFKPGIGYMVVHLGVPVVPLKTEGLSGTMPLHAKWPKRKSNVTVRFGEPMRFVKTKNYVEVTESLRLAVVDL